MGLISMRPFQLPSGAFYIIGGTGSPVKFATSTNATSWDAIQQNVKTDFAAVDTLSTILSVRYGNGFFLAAGYNATTPVVLKSYDGLNWKQVYATSNLDFTYVDLDYAHGRFLLAGTKSVLVSTDGEDWTYGQIGVTNPLLDNNNNQLAGITAISHTDTWHVIFDATNGVFVSTDGISWTFNHSGGYAAGIIVTHLPWSNNLLFAENNTGNVVLSVSNGTSIVPSFFPSSPSQTNTATAVNAVEIINGVIYIVITEDGIHKVIKSTDTDGFVYDWADQDASLLGTDIGANNNYILGVNGDAVLYSLDNGTTWKTFGVEYTFSLPLNAILFGDTFWTFTGQIQNYTVLSSTDWVLRTDLPLYTDKFVKNPTDNSYASIVDFFSVSSKQIVTSTDGLIWNTQTFTVDGDYQEGLQGFTLALTTNSTNYPAGYFTTGYDFSNASIDASIVKSTDGGLTWTTVYSNMITYDQNVNYIDIRYLVPDTGNTDQQILAVGFSSGLPADSLDCFILSQDNGQSWGTYVMNFTYFNDVTSFNDVKYDLNTGYWLLVGNNQGIFKFSQGSGVFESNAFPTDTNAYSIAIATNGPYQSRIVAIGDAYNSVTENINGCVMYSDDYGATWTYAGFDQTFTDGVNTFAGWTWISSFIGPMRYQDGIFTIATGHSYAYSPDGVNWAYAVDLVGTDSAYDLLITSAPPTIFPTPINPPPL